LGKGYPVGKKMTLPGCQPLNEGRELQKPKNGARPSAKGLRKPKKRGVLPNQPGQRVGYELRATIQGKSGAEVIAGECANRWRSLVGESLQLGGKGGKHAHWQKKTVIQTLREEGEQGREVITGGKAHPAATRVRDTRNLSHLKPLKKSAELHGSWAECHAPKVTVPGVPSVFWNGG